MPQITIPANATASVLYNLCKENGIDIRSKQRKEIYIEAIAVHNLEDCKRVYLQTLALNSVAGEVLEKKLKRHIKKSTENAATIKMLKMIKFPESMIINEEAAEKYGKEMRLPLETLHSYILQRGFLRMATFETVRIEITGNTKAIDYERAIIDFIIAGVKTFHPVSVDYDWVNNLSMINDVLGRLGMPIMWPSDFHDDDQVRSSDQLQESLENIGVFMDEITIVNANIRLANSIKRPIFGFLMPASEPVVIQIEPTIEPEAPIAAPVPDVATVIEPEAPIAVKTAPAKKSTVTKARVKATPVKPSQDAPQATVTPDKVETPATVSGAVTGDKTYTLAEVFCMVYKVDGKDSRFEGFRQQLRLTATITNIKTRDNAFTNQLDLLGFTRDVRCQWTKNGVPHDAMIFIVENRKNSVR
jgi:hypothetical protein